jgi:electron transfer flavoprotein beta subunit
MKIIIPIKQVPETSKVKMDPISGTMIRTGVESIINPLDLYAIETAIRLKEKFGAMITVISMGPAQAMKAIREAIAMGCDDGVLLSDRAFGGSDTWATAYALSLGIQKIGGADLILCGERATDGDTGQVGPGMAAMLDLPLVTYVGKIESDTSGSIRAERLVEGGREIVSVKPPVLITVVKEIGVPRLPTLRGILRAKAADVKTWGPGDLSADPNLIGLNGSPTRVVRIHHPQVTRKGEQIIVKDRSDIEKAVQRILDFMKQRNII